METVYGGEGLMGRTMIKAQLPRDFEKRQNEIPNKMTMGSASELLELPQYKRLSKINGNYGSFTEGRQVRFYYKASTVLSSLRLPIKLREEVLKNAESFYSSLEKGTYHRGEKTLIPTSIYITCLERFIFMRRKDFYPFCSKHDFDRCLKAILIGNDPLRKKLLSKCFRTKTILVQLNGLKERFFFNGLFYNVAVENLHKYYDEMKNATNTAITGAIFDLTVHQLIGKFVYLSEVCRFLGIVQSTIFRRRLY